MAGIWIGDGGGGSLSQQSSSSSVTSTIIESGERLRMSHTSPVSVPCKTNARQRNESTSSLNVGSWQYVSTTGSLRSTASGSTISSHSRSSGERERERQGDTALTDSLATLTDSLDGCFINQLKHSSDHSQCGSSCAVRRQRLDSIRKLFSTCYCQSIGHNLKDGSEASGISNIFGNLAGKIMKS